MEINIHKNQVIKICSKKAILKVWIDNNEIIKTCKVIKEQ